MDTPLGRAVGNAVEVEEAVATLRGEGPPDLVAVTLALAREMLRLAGIDADPAAALADGRALAAYRAMITRAGRRPGRAAAAWPRHTRQTLTAPEAGWLRRLDARGGRRGRLAARRGRARKEDPVSAAAGVLCLAKPGERVERRPAGAGAAHRRRVPVRRGPRRRWRAPSRSAPEPPRWPSRVIDRIEP